MRDDDNPLFPPRDPDEVAAEAEVLAEIDQRSWPGRCLGYLRLSGPGFLQSAFSLGGGSLGSSLLAGALLGYALLWVQPIAMACGVVMLLAMAYQVMHAKERPLEAVNRYVHPVMGWGWALCSLLASLIWVMPQYTLAVDVIGDMSGVAFEGPISLLPSGVILLVVSAIVWNYGSRRGVRVFEWITRGFIVLIIASFFLVVCATGVRLGWDALLAGFFGFHLPHPGASYPGWDATVAEVAGSGAFSGQDAATIGAGIGATGLDVLLAAFSAAVGINMTFLFPYSIRARGWGPQHRRLARYDLILGMLIPFALTTSLLIIAAGNTLHGTLVSALLGQKPGAAQLAATLEPLAGPVVAHWIFGLGVLGMALSSIAMMMLVCGFVVMELTGKPFGSRAHRIGLLLPAIGVLAPILWSKLAFYIVVPTSIACLVFLPVAYISVVILHNRRAYLGDAMPTGRRRLVWNIALLGALGIVLIAVGRALYLKLPALVALVGGG